MVQTVYIDHIHVSTVNQVGKSEPGNKVIMQPQPCNDVAESTSYTGTESTSCTGIDSILTLVVQVLTG